MQLQKRPGNNKADNDKKQNEEINKKIVSFRLSDNPGALVARDLSVRYVNEAFKKLTGFSESEIIGVKPPYPWWTNEMAHNFEMNLPSLNQKGLVKKIKTKKGNILKVKASSEVFFINDTEKYIRENWADIAPDYLKKEGPGMHFINDYKDLKNKKKEESANFGPKENLSHLNNLIGLLKQAPETYLLINSSGKLIYSNKVSFNGIILSHLIAGAGSIDALFSADITAKIKDRIYEVKNDKDAQSMEIEESGLYYNIHISFLESLGKENYISLRIQDISNYRIQESHLKESINIAENERAKNSAIIASLGDGLTILDEDFRIIYQNKIFRDNFGDYLGRFCFEALLKKNSFCEDCPAAMSFGDINKLKKAISTEQGTKYYEFSVVPYKNNDGKIIGIIEMVHDITEHIRAQKELKRSREELRDLAVHLEFVREETSKRKSLEIREELGNALTDLKLDASWLIRKIPENELFIKERLEDMSGLIDKTAEKIKSISAELRPSILDQLGLIPAIKWLLEEFSKKTNINTSLYIKNKGLLFDENTSTIIFRILQEALKNIELHSGATSAEIHLKKNQSHMEFIVKDNGVGIHKDKIKSHSSFGIIGMRERAISLGGSVEINSPPNQGSAIKVKIPLDNERKNKKIKILLADENSIYRKGLKDVIEEDLQLKITDEVFNESTLLDKISKDYFDVLMIDLNLPGRNPLEIIRDILNYRPDIKILALNSDNDRHYGLRLMKLGISGIIYKSESPDEIIKAIYRINDNKKYIPDFLAEDLARSFEIYSSEILHEKLSNREFQVLKMIGKGMRIKDIAGELYLSSKTVTTYRARILEKMNFTKNSELTRYCLKHDLLNDG